MELWCIGCVGGNHVTEMIVTFVEEGYLMYCPICVNLSVSKLSVCYSMVIVISWPK